MRDLTSLVQGQRPVAVTASTASDGAPEARLSTDGRSCVCVCGGISVILIYPGRQIPRWIRFTCTSAGKLDKMSIQARTYRSQGYSEKITIKLQ